MPRYSLTFVAGNLDGNTSLSFGDHLARDLAADVGDFAIQIAHARFVRVVADEMR